MISSMIVEGKPDTSFNQERILFGSYSLFYTGTSKNMNRKIIPYISLNKSNYHLGHYFISLYTGKILHIYEWTELPIENYVIEKVKKFSSYEKGQLVKDKYPMFEWVTGIPILDEIQEESPDMIDEDELDVEDIGIKYDDNVQEEGED